MPERAPSSAAAARKAALHRLVELYGADNVRDLIALLASAAPSDQIARRYGVSRQAVNRWRRQFVDVRRVWSPHADCQVVLREESAGEPRMSSD